VRAGLSDADALQGDRRVELRIRVGAKKHAQRKSAASGQGGQVSH
jgi:hypothetical protein